MELELLDLINKYANSNGDIANFVSEACEILIIHYKLNDYLKKIYVNTMEIPSNRMDGIYYAIDRKMIIYIKSFIKYFNNHIPLYKKDYNIEMSELKVFKYASMLEILLHEFNHVIQKSKFDLNDPDIETQILRISCRDSFFNKRDLYRELKKLGFDDNTINIYIDKCNERYDTIGNIVPEERFASNSSNLSLVYLSSNYENINSFFLNHLFYCLMNGYKKVGNAIICPTSTYLEYSGYECDKLPSSSYESLSKEKRFKLGLPLNSDEFDEIILKLTK